MKAQSLIVQFILFFLIGLAIFLTIGNLFRIQQDAFVDSVLDSSIKLVNSYLSSYSILIVDNCKDCQLVRVPMRIRNTTAGHYLEIDFSKNYINVNVVGKTKSFGSSAHNLNYSITFAGSSISFLPIKLLYNKTALNII